MSKTLALISETREERTAIDERLLENARKSITELAELTNLDVGDVAERLSRLLEDRGWMNERQEERYMLIELGDLIADAKDRLKRVSDEDYAGVAKIVLGAMQQMADRWDKRRQMVEADIEKITMANARLFGRGYDVALNHLVEGLKLLHPEITDEEVELLVDEGLDLAKVIVNEKVIL